MTKKTIGERIRQIRGMTGLTRIDFAEKHGLSHPSLRSWELNYTNISKNTLQKIINTAQKENIYVSLDWLTNGSMPGPYMIDPSLKSENAIKSNNDPIIEFVCTDHNYTPYIDKGDIIGAKIININSLATKKRFLVAIKEENIYRIKLIYKINKKDFLFISPNHSSQDKVYEINSSSNIELLYYVTWIQKKTPD